MEHSWTQPELIEAGTSLLEAGMFGLTIYLSVVSGYLVVAYIAGQRLSRFQLFTISILFVTFSTFASFGSFGLTLAAVTTLSYTEREVGAFMRAISISIPYSILVVQLLGIGLSLKFMFDQRKVSN